MAEADDTPRLLDTSVFSLFLKPHDSRTGLYLPHLVGRPIAISFVTVGEIYKWAYLRRWGAARISEMDKVLSQHIVVLPSSQDVAREWARIQTSDHPLNENDAWIAACAIVYGCTLVSDDADFRGVRGLRVIIERQA